MQIIRAQNIKFDRMAVTFVLMTFVHIGNISAVTEPALTQLFGTKIFLDPQFFPDKNFLGAQINLDPNLFTP